MRCKVYAALFVHMQGYAGNHMQVLCKSHTGLDVSECEPPTCEFCVADSGNVTGSLGYDRIYGESCRKLPCTQAIRAWTYALATVLRRPMLPRSNLAASMAARTWSIDTRQSIGITNPPLSSLTIVVIDTWMRFKFGTESLHPRVRSMLSGQWSRYFATPQ